MGGGSADDKKQNINKWLSKQAFIEEKISGITYLDLNHKVSQKYGSDKGRALCLLSLWLPLTKGAVYSVGVVGRTNNGWGAFWIHE